MQTNWKEELNSLLNCDLKSLYPLARSMDRKLQFFVGPTNSGKTYAAMKELKGSDCGIYLAPLRLLALEGYETLKKDGIATSLITGEEEIFNEDAAHICSTIEMIDFNLDVDAAVIDEVQMLDDEDRGWAWVNAIIGAPAKKVIMTGSVNALEAVKKIAAYLDEELEVVKFKRKNELEVLENATNLRNIEPHTALIAFSRNDVLKFKQKLSKYHKVSVIYGNLSPEVRRDEARRFREGQTDILIATDAIAMGLNLPIKTILFTTDTKFDGISRRKITSNEIVQICGRAGRYGHHEKGYIGAISKSVLSHIQKEFIAPIKTIKPPYKVKASSVQIEELSRHLKTNDLSTILNFFANNMYFNGPFIAANIKSMIQTSKILDSKKSMKLEEKYLFAQAPVSLNSPLVKSAYIFYINSILNKNKVKYKATITLKDIAKTENELLQAEDEVKKISLYLWLSYKFPNYFTDYDKAYIIREKINRIIENSLKAGIKRSETGKKHHYKGKEKNRDNRYRSKGLGKKNKKNYWNKR